MDINVDSKRTSVSMHIRKDSEVQVVGYPPKEGGNRRFVSLSLGEGKYPNTQEFTAYMGVEQATQLMEALRDAIAQAGCG